MNSPKSAIESQGFHPKSLVLKPIAILRNGRLFDRLTGHSEAFAFFQHESLSFCHSDPERSEGEESKLAQDKLCEESFIEVKTASEILRRPDSPGQHRVTLPDAFMKTKPSPERGTRRGSREDRIAFESWLFFRSPKNYGLAAIFKVTL
jgi:hypothetical protein